MELRIEINVDDLKVASEILDGLVPDLEELPDMARAAVMGKLGEVWRLVDGAARYPSLRLRAYGEGELDRGDLIRPVSTFDGELAFQPVDGVGAANNG